MKHLLFPICLLLLLAGCASGDKVPASDRLDKNIMTVEKTFRADTLKCIDTLIYAKEFFVYRDSVLIVLNNRNEDTHFLEFYRLSDMRPITQLYRSGNGPDELLSANVDINGNTLTVNDFIKSQVAVVDIDSLLADPTYSASPVRLKVESLFNATPYKDRFLLDNPYSFADEKAGIVQEAPRFIVTDEEKTYEEKNKYQYYTRNVTGGRIIANEAKNRVVYANGNQSSVEIYDMELNLLRTITGPVDLPTQYVIHNEEGGMPNEVIFKTNIPYAYVDYCTDDDYFYLTYVGDMFGRGQKEQDLNFIIFKFDWDGNFIDSYPVHSYVRSISKSRKDDAFYVTILSSDGLPVLIKLYEKGIL